MKGGYETLDVYVLAFELAVRIDELTEVAPIPKHEFYGGSVSQIRRSSTSVCANLAEGLSKRQSMADEYKFLSIAMGSAEETRMWLAFLARRKRLDEQVANEMREEYARVCKMIYTLQLKRKPQ